MKPVRTKAIVLRRTNYGEADRVLQLLTPEQGKLAVMAKGVRREKSRLAGGIELFAVSDVVLAPGKGEIWTLTGAKMDIFFARIMADYERMQFGYTAIKQLSRLSEQVTDPVFFELLLETFAALNDQTISLHITMTWFWLQLGILEGQGMNLATDINGMKLVEGKNYTFDLEAMAFSFNNDGDFTTEHIKLLRLLSAQPPKVAARVKNITPLVAQCWRLTEAAIAR